MHGDQYAAKVDPCPFHASPRISRGQGTKSSSEGFCLLICPPLSTGPNGEQSFRGPLAGDAEPSERDGAAVGAIAGVLDPSGILNIP
jgi:hypothetical protein